MTALEAFRNSNVWHKEFNLPLSPTNNNPHFYCALSAVIIKRYDGSDLGLDVDVMKYQKACEKEPGLFQRWPKQAPDDVTSHDELIGICYFNPAASYRILEYLKAHWGWYNNSNQKEPVPFAWNIWRFFWFMAFVKARAGVRVSFFYQFMFSWRVFFDALLTKEGTDDASGRLLTWVMAEEMLRFPICKKALVYFNTRMLKIGATPAAMLKLEPKENPVLAQYAPATYL